MAMTPKPKLRRGSQSCAFLSTWLYNPVMDLVYKFGFAVMLATVWAGILFSLWRLGKTNRRIRLTLDRIQADMAAELAHYGQVRHPTQSPGQH